MRTTKNLTVSLPPAMLKDMQRAAKRENRTLSELVRENFHRAQMAEAERQLLADPLRASRLAEFKQALYQVQAEATAKGLDKISEREIDAEVQAVRRQRRKEIKSPAK